VKCNIIKLLKRRGLAMNYRNYMKKEIEKAIFVEINEDVQLNLKGNSILKKGEYPILPEDVINLAKSGMETIPVAQFIKGMIYMIACDPDFIYTKDYIDTLKSIEGIESYIIMEIEKYKKENLKKAVTYVTALCTLNPKKEYLYNRVRLLIEHYDKTNLDFLNEEIISSLEKLCETYPDFSLPHYHLGQYYLDKDLDLAKMHLRKCQNDSIIGEEAIRLLQRIKNVEEYDQAVELVQNGQGYEALKILIPICEDNPENLDAKYYAAVAFRQTENYHKALLYLKELLNIAERPEVYAEIGINLAALNDFESAIEYFKKALKIKPDDSGIICNIAVCQLNLGNIDEAKKNFELAARINPKDEIALSWIERLKEV
jgi:tetratricopeptide (TPR) repeat protein